MEALKKEITIPENHHLLFDFKVPDTFPVGNAEVMLVFQPAAKPAAANIRNTFKQFRSIKLNTLGFKFNRDTANEH